MAGKPELAVKAQAVIGEGPFWDKEDELLYWVDIAEKSLFIHDPEALTTREIAVGQFIGSAAARNSHELVVALEDGFFILDTRAGKLTAIADPEAHIPGNRFNDGKCDARGRFWAGTQPSDGKGDATEERDAAALYRLDPDRTVRKMIDGVSISNGIAWSPDNRIMYFIDSRIMGVAAFDFDLETGGIKNRRYPIVIPTAGHGVPDGMTRDDEGMLYIAEWNGYQVSKWNPKTGECVDSIKFPIAKITSCAFGGPRLDELFVTTARLGVRPDDEAQRDAGSVFRIHTDTSGAESHRYAG
jgi:sugar lactone lactonase YvrE